VTTSLIAAGSVAGARSSRRWRRSAAAAVPSVIAARPALGIAGAALVAVVLYVSNFAWIALNNVIAASACARVGAAGWAGRRVADAVGDRARPRSRRSSSGAARGGRARRSRRGAADAAVGVGADHRVHSRARIAGAPRPRAAA
jgi:hypothetical protein